MEKLQQRTSIIGLGVNNLEIATDFYQNMFGWELTEASNENIKFFQLNGLLLSLYPREKLAEDAEVDHTGEGFKAFSLAYNTNSKVEVDQIFKLFKSKGVKIVKAPQEVFWGGYSGYIADPDDNLWEIAFNPYMKFDESGNVI